jgi:hypothetical protein
LVQASKVAVTVDVTAGAAVSVAVYVAFAFAVAVAVAVTDTYLVRPYKALRRPHWLVLLLLLLLLSSLFFDPFRMHGGFGFRNWDLINQHQYFTIALLPCFKHT